MAPAIMDGVTLPTVPKDTTLSESVTQVPHTNTPSLILQAVARLLKSASLPKRHIMLCKRLTHSLDLGELTTTSRTCSSGRRFTHLNTISIWKVSFPTPK